MDLRSAYPYWLLRHGIVNSYPSLQKNSTADVAIIGAGITGALVGWHLAKAGKKVIVVDKRHVGMGSTAASTALLQYEIDTPLRELIEKVGKKDAERSYLLCRKSIYDLQQICKGLPKECGFELRPSFQFASYKKDMKEQEEEYALRKQIGIPLKKLNREQVKKTFGFDAPSGLLSADGAVVDAYRLSHALLEQAAKKGLKVFDGTTITEIRHKRSGVELETDTGAIIKAKHLVIACGYESQQYLEQQVELLHSTYAIVSEPFQEKKLWYKDALIWETADPYIYLRTTPDNRILIGGMDDDFSDPQKRDERLPQKAKALEAKCKSLFPHLPFKTDFKWAGTFAGTKDGLPYIGKHKSRPNTYFALGFGGNGITFSIIAAQLIRDELMGKENPDLSIFSFNR